MTNCHCDEVVFEYIFVYVCVRRVTHTQGSTACPHHAFASLCAARPHGLGRFIHHPRSMHRRAHPRNHATHSLRSARHDPCGLEWSIYHSQSLRTWPKNDQRRGDKLARDYTFFKSCMSGGATNPRIRTTRSLVSKCPTGHSKPHSVQHDPRACGGPLPTA